MKYVREYDSAAYFQLGIEDMLKDLDAELVSWQAVQSESAIFNGHSTYRELHFSIIAVFEDKLT